MSGEVAKMAKWMRKAGIRRSERSAAGILVVADKGIRKFDSCGLISSGLLSIKLVKPF